MDLQSIHKIAQTAAYKGAEVVRSHLGALTRIDKKGAIDLVTEADIGSEKQIITTIMDAYPDHSILAEESGQQGQNSECLWIIDPLDGTTNFAHQLPIFAISIAFALKGECEVGLVLNPISGELFSAIRGKGATLSGLPINVSSADKISESLLVTGFPYNTDAIAGNLLNRFIACLQSAQGVRRLGSAALDLCYVACGRFDGYWEQYLSPWDTAAGALIASEAGAQVTDFADRPFRSEYLEILATNGHIHKEMLAKLSLKEME